MVSTIFDSRRPTWDGLGKDVSGAWIASGLNLLLSTTVFTASSLPLVCATLAMVGSFFKSTQQTNSK